MKKTSEVPNRKSQSRTSQTPLNRYFTGEGHVLGHLSSYSKDILSDNINLDRSGNNVVSSGMKLKMQPTGNCCTKDDLRTQKIVSTAEGNTTAVAMPKNDFGLLVKEKILGSSRSTGAGNIESVDSDIIICVACPVCNVYVPENAINSHLDSCLKQNSFLCL